MKFEINTRIAKDYIRKVSSLVPNFSELPENSGVLITVFDTKVEMKSKNSYVSIKLETNDLNSMQIFETGSILIKGKMLNEIVSKMSGDKIEFTKVDENILIIKSDDAEYEVNLLDRTNYMEENIDYGSALGDEIVISAKSFKEAIAKTQIAVPEKHQRKILQGINVTSDGGVIRFIGTEGIRIQKVELQGQSQEMNHTINIKTAKELVKIMPESGDIQLKFNQGTLTVKAGETLIKGRLLEGAYPNVLKPFQANYSKELMIGREDFVSLIDQATVMNQNKQSDTAILKIVISNGVLRFESRELETGYANIKTKNFKFSQEELFSISFNPKYMVDALKATSGEAIKIKMESSVMPMIVQGNDSKTLESLILPFRTN